MKKSLLFIATLLAASTGFSKTLLTCVGHVNEGDQVEGVVLTKDANGPSVIFNGVSQSVVRTGQANVLSTKYVLQKSQDGEDLLSLVVNLKTKQAVLLYEVDLRGTVTPPEYNRYNVTVQFLDCK